MTEPQRIYTLFTRPAAEPTTKPGFYVGGTIYSDWASVPESYRTSIRISGSEPVHRQHLQVHVVSPVRYLPICAFISS